MSALEIAPLSSEKIVAAYPLIRAVAPVSLERWRRYVRQLEERKGEILAASDRSGRVFGLAVFYRDDGKKAAPYLHVEMLASFDLPTSSSSGQLLKAALEIEADRHGCAGVLMPGSVRPYRPAPTEAGV